MMRDKKYLTPLQVVIAPYVARFLRRERHERLLKRRQETIAAAIRARELAALKLAIQREARMQAQIVRERLAGIGFSYAHSGRYAEEGQRRRRQVAKIKFELIRYNEYGIWLKVLTHRLRLLGGASNELPHRTTVAALIDPKVEFELSIACGRRVAILANNPRKGVWIVIYRTLSGGMLPALVNYSAVLQYYPPVMDKAHIVLGVGEHNKIAEIDLDSYPHMLIAGAANSGKSNLLNNILASIVRFATPEEIQLILVDPKKVEFVAYQDAPHLVIFQDDKGEIPRIIERVSDAIRSLRYANRVIDERTEIIKKARVKKLSEYNAKHKHEPLPRLVVVIDELASLWRPGRRKERDRVHSLLKRIANMGRAMGVHLILCTQVPTKTNVPMDLKANLWVRVAGKLPDHVSSQIILGTGDAAWIEDIKGRMVYAIDAARHVIQAPRITEDDIYESVRIAKGRAAGLITYVGLEIVPLRDAILRRLITEDMAIHKRDCQTYFSVYAVPREFVGVLVDEILDCGVVETELGTFRVQRRGNHLHLVGAMGGAEEANHEVIMIEPPTLKLLPATVGGANLDAPPPAPEIIIERIVERYYTLKEIERHPEFEGKILAETLRKAIQQGRFQALKQGRQYMVTPEDVRGFLRKQNRAGRAGRPARYQNGAD